MRDERQPLAPADEWERVRVLLLEAANDTEALPSRESLANVIRFACFTPDRPPEHVFEFFRRLHGVERARPSRESLLRTAATWPESYGPLPAWVAALSEDS